MWLLLSLLLLLLPTALCVPRIRSDERSNLLLVAGQGKNISAIADSIFLNGEEIITKDEVLSMLNAFQTTISQQSEAISQLNSAVSQLDASTQTEINALQTENQKLQEQLAVLNGSTTTLQTALDTLTTQTTNEIDNINTKLTVLQPQIDESCASSTPSLSLPLFQQIDTSGAFDWEYFTINNHNYLAVANYRNEVSFNIKSSIYRFNTTTQQFVLFQQMDTEGALEWEFFTINNTSYLAVVNHYNGTSYNIKSNIYRFDTTAQQFVPFQQIDTNGARDWEFFILNNTNYLAVANYYNDESSNINSNIYRFDSTMQLFVLFQQIDTNGALDWQYFTFNYSSYLAVAHHENGESYDIKSNIYRYDSTIQQFVLFQQIDTNGATEWEYFSINNANYLAIANQINDLESFNIKSNIYRLNTTTQQFALFQQIDTIGTRNWKYFNINNTSYLAVVNQYDGTTYNIKSNIYRFDSTAQQFVLFLQIDTNGALDWEFFTINNTMYLAVANLYNDVTYDVKSNIYRLSNVAACWDVD